MAFCFDAVSRGTIADGAKLEIIEVPGGGRMPVLRQERRDRRGLRSPPEMRGYPVHPTEGTEMRVRELEVD